MIIDDYVCPPPPRRHVNRRRANRMILTDLPLPPHNKLTIAPAQKVHRSRLYASRVTSTTRHELVPNIMTVGADCPNCPKRLQLQHWM